MRNVNKGPMNDHIDVSMWLQQLSKAALIDICVMLIGDVLGEHEYISAKRARDRVQCVLEDRGDRIPKV